MKRPLIVLTGPTAVGKTSLSISLAKAVNGEIISADSMQVYKKMDIGSAKIRPEEMQGVKHYLVDVLEPEEEEQPEEFQAEPEDDTEMDLDAFANYACDYARSIDCSLKDKSMLALYERIEIMEEDGIPLTKANAEALIEEAADKAEKPSLGKRIKGLFSSKYDKDGLLILKEEHFI